NRQERNVERRAQVPDHRRRERNPEPPDDHHHRQREDQVKASRRLAVAARPALEPRAGEAGVRAEEQAHEREVPDDRGAEREREPERARTEEARAAPPEVNEEGEGEST